MLPGQAARDATALCRRATASWCQAHDHAPDAMATAAKAAGRCLRTIRRWCEAALHGATAPKVPGRRRVEVDRGVRVGLYLTLLTLGVHTSEQVLRGLFHDVPFSCLRDMKQRMKRALARHASLMRGHLTWRQAGRVWTTDFTAPKARLPGGCNRLLHVRDLGSGAVLAIVATTNERAADVLALLTRLIAIHGAPLVIKSDNGGAFRAHAVQELLAAHGVTYLPSPAYRPQYNGSCERSGGHDKLRIEAQAAADGHPGEWTPRDIARAMAVANDVMRPWGAKGPTRGEVLAAASAISAEERRTFQETYALLLAREEMRYAASCGTTIPRCKNDVLRRRAVKNALVQLGYLTIRGGPVSTPFPAGLEDSNS